MNGQEPERDVSRRGFLKRGARTAGALAAVGAGLDIFEQLAMAANEKNANPFPYDVGRLSKTDPKLIAYEETARFKCPRGEARRISRGTDDQLLIAAGNYISILGPDGALQSEIALGGPAQAVAVAKDGTIYVGLRNHIEVFDAKGQRKASWEAIAKRPWITGMAVAENDVFAADSGNRVVWRYDREGKVAGRIGEKNKDRNIPGFVVPSPYLDVVLHRDGLIRVNNPGSHLVEAYTFDGDRELAWGRYSAAIDGFCGCCNPIALDVLPDGRIVTCEKGIPRVKVYANDGAFECVVAGAESFPENLKATEGGDAVRGALDAAVDSRGRICVLDPVSQMIRVMARKGDTKGL
jgi:hypothetical protein